MNSSQCSKKKKNDDNLTSVQVRFCYQMNHGTKFRKKKTTLIFTAFWIRDLGPLTSLTRPFPDFVISTDLPSCLSFSWVGDTISHHRTEPQICSGNRLPGVTVLSMRTL